MKSRIASAISSFMAGRAINKSRPRLPDAFAEASPSSMALDELPEPPELPEPAGVGISELEAMFAISGGMDRVASMMGRALRFNRADSFCNPKRTPEYSPDSLRLGAIRA
jgi:hypothetical protein